MSRALVSRGPGTPVYKALAPDVTRHHGLVWQVLGDIQFKFYHQWFDFIFILSALFFLAVFYTIDCSRQPSSLSTIKVPPPPPCRVWCLAACGAEPRLLSERGHCRRWRRTRRAPTTLRPFTSTDTFRCEVTVRGN